MKEIIEEALKNISTLMRRIEETNNMPLMLIYDRNLNKVRKFVSLNEFHEELVLTENAYAAEQNLRAYYNRNEGQVKPTIKHSIEKLKIQLQQLQKLIGSKKPKSV